MKYCFEEKKKVISIAATAMFIVTAGFFYFVSGRAEDIKDGGSQSVVSESDDQSGSMSFTDDENNKNDETEATSDDKSVTVHVCGAVNNPGVYTFEKEVRLTDVIDEAGGFKENAAQDYLNLAERVADGQKITVYTKKQIKNRKNMQENDNMERSSNVVNINSASKEELMSIPGIGEAKAEDIIKYREENGLFKEVREIMNIPGIKEGIYSKISDMITIE